MSTAPHSRLWSQPFRLADMPAGAVAFSLSPDAAVRRAIAEELGLLGLRKLRFVGEIAPSGESDWRLSGRLGATLVQACVVTLAPVSTRIDEDISRMFVAGLEAPDGGGEFQIPDDVATEALGAILDPGLVMVEALALARPDYPRAPDAPDTDSAQPVGKAFAEPGVKPMTDQDARPFAALKALRDTLDEKPG